MLTIIKIKFSADHITVELDNGESLEMPSRMEELYKLAAGKSIDHTEYTQLKEESQRFSCKKRALNYLAAQMRSAGEMERYLQKKGFSQDAIREVVVGLLDSGYINDAEYAARFISRRLHKKLVGKRLLASELHKKGIARTIIRQALNESESLYGTDDEVYEAALKKYDTLKHKKNGISKLAYFLQRRGFESEVVNTILRRIQQKERQL